MVVRIFDPLEHLGLCPPLDQLHSEHLVEEILHSLAIWPGFPQLKQESGFLLRLGILALPLPLVKASISASLSSSVKVSRALTSIVSGSQVLAHDLVSFRVSFHVTSFSFSSFDQFPFFSLLRDLTWTWNGTWHADSDIRWALLYTQTTIHGPGSFPSDPQ